MWPVTFFGIFSSLSIIILLLSLLFSPLFISISPMHTPIPSRTLFVIAHPDDEAMFFAPTILSLSSHVLHLICLSVGNNDGLGKIREKELYKSCEVLGITKERVRIYNEQGLQDGPHNSWDSSLVMNIVKNFVDEFQIDNIITFDEHGISSHPNHIDTFKGVRKFISSQSEVTAYKLETTNIIRKYISFVDIPLSFAFKTNSTLLYMNPGIFTGWRAMKQHYSQLVWFRYLFILFTRYSFINTLNPL